MVVVLEKDEESKVCDSALLFMTEFSIGVGKIFLGTTQPRTPRKCVDWSRIGHGSLEAVICGAHKCLLRRIHGAVRKAKVYSRAFHFVPHAMGRVSLCIRGRLRLTTHDFRCSELDPALLTSAIESEVTHLNLLANRCRVAVSGEVVKRLFGFRSYKDLQSIGLIYKPRVTSAGSFLGH